jgi:NAD-dependent DNA ligase
VTSVMADQRIDEAEHKMLKAFFSEFLPVFDERTINAPTVEIGGSVVGLCAVCPEIVFADSTFCFTGASGRYTRKQLAATVAERGGVVTEGVSAKVHYLVIGADGNPCWSFACYGRKVERAVELRKAGAKLQLIHENDFHDAVQDN